jgi:cytochrome c2
VRHALSAIAVVALAAAAPVGAQLTSRPARPQVVPPQGPVRQVIFKHCTSCHGIDDYAYHSLDTAGWNALLEERHKARPVKLAVADREMLVDWLVSKFGPGTRPFPRAYVPPEITTFFSDAEAETVLTRSCTVCHDLERVNNGRFSPDRWRVLMVDMRERGAEIADEELERLVEWLGRTKGTNPNQ